MSSQKGQSKDSIHVDMDDKPDNQASHLDKLDASIADEAEHKLTMRNAFKLYYKAVLWSATLSMALVMESYGEWSRVTRGVVN